MNKVEALKYYNETITRLMASNYAYKNWGKVDIIEVGLRLDNNEILKIKGSGETIQQEVISINNTKSLLATILRKRKKINAILITTQTNASKVEETIPPILDDQAQLLGPTLRFVSLSSDIKTLIKKIIKGLSGRYATILSNQQCICLGKNLEEAYVAAQLVEKTAKAFTEAKYIGGAKAINIIEAWLMHKFYLMKYSKESEKNK